MSRAATLQTIADRVGVSRATVSNAFSRPEQLSSALREKILATAEELGYAGPDPAGRALARGTTGAVGVLLTDSLHEAFDDEVATAFLGGVVQELAPTGLALTLLTADDGTDFVSARDVAIDGALIYSCKPTSTARDWLMRRRLPLVYVDQIPDGDIPTVNVDDRGGARAAAQHLLELGHRRIGILNRAVDDSAGLIDDPLQTLQGHPQRERLLGWLDALEPAGVRPTIVHVPHRHVPHGSDRDAREGARTLLTLDERPTAILCFADVIAFHAMAVARELGLDVPGDVSVVGFDDTASASRFVPALTTVRQDVVAKGRAAAALLTAAIERHRADAPGGAQHVLLDTELIVRDSTAPPR